MPRQQSGIRRAGLATVYYADSIPSLLGRDLSYRNMKTGDSSTSIRFRLAISAEEYLAYYQGGAQNVVARSEDNRTIQFPASAIRDFLTHAGIFGTFEITFDENNKLISIRPIS